MKKLLKAGFILGLLCVAGTASADTIYVDPSGEYDTGSGTTTAETTIQAAIATSTAGDTINVAAGTYVEAGQIVIDKNLSIFGVDKNSVIIMTDSDTGTSGDSRGWVLVNNGVDLTLSNVTLDGSGHNIHTGIRFLGGGNVNNSILKNIGYEPNGPCYCGFAINLNWESTTDRHVDVLNNEFMNYGRVGVHVDRDTNSSTATINGNTFTGKGSGNHLDYAVEVEDGAHADVINNIITGNKGVANDGSTSAGVLVTTFFSPTVPANTSATITGNTFSDNTNGIAVGYEIGDTATVIAHNNKFLSSTEEHIVSTNPSNPVDAESNWWGVTASSSVDALAEGNVDFDPWFMNEEMTVLSTVGPTITLNGDANMNMFTSNPFTDPGATAVDSIGRSLEVSLPTPPDTSVPGSHTLTYTATDENGLQASVTRTLSVRAASGGGGGGGGGSSSSDADAAGSVTPGEVLGAATVAPGQVLGAFDVSVTILSAQAIAALSPAERQVYITNTKNALIAKITELISILQGQLNVALAAQGL